MKLVSSSYFHNSFIWNMSILLVCFVTEVLISLSNTLCIKRYFSYTHNLMSTALSSLLVISLLRVVFVILGILLTVRFSKVPQKLYFEQLLLLQSSRYKPPSNYDSNSLF